ncbi:PilZ domain-containing protein [Gilvimarinus chinensis]|uniref:PilZ domain-containing protein n=1 Tax=Gilvimarinus chinensis TaxID=396005 RepID=UPI0003603011|nr:PilZ domain-containing protein [Gilvimarinus chinensis]
MAISDHSYDEKRDFIRMKINAPLQAQLTSGEITHVGTCTELSGGGLQVILDSPLEEGSEWEVNINSEHGHSPQLKAKVKVIRAEAVEANYATGFQITEIID